MKALVLSFAILLAHPLYAQFDCTAGPPGFSLTIVKYTGPGGDVVIPDAIYGIPVSTIREAAFRGATGMTSVTFGKNIVEIGEDAFRGCYGLTNVVIPTNVVTIWPWAFGQCTNLTAAYFAGNRPPGLVTGAFDLSPTTIYYLPGTTGWGTNVGSAPVVPWAPKIMMKRMGGVVVIKAAGNWPLSFNPAVRLQYCTDLSNPVWLHWFSITRPELEGDGAGAWAVRPTLFARVVAAPQP